MVERKLWVQPSGKASDIQLFRTSDKGEQLLIKNDEDLIRMVGEELEGLCK